MESLCFNLPLCLLLSVGSVPSIAVPLGGQIVYPELVEARGINGEKTLKISSDLTLNLKPVNLLPKKFLFSEYEEETFQDHYLDGDDYQSNVYYDDKHMAALWVDDSDGIRVDGVLGDRLRIEPTIGREQPAAGPIAHLLHETPLTERKATIDVDEEYDEYEYEEQPPVTADELATPPSRQPRESGAGTDGYVAELVLGVDTKFKDKFGYHEKKHQQLITYLLVLVASVSLKTTQAGIRLRLVAIITDKSVEPTELLRRSQHCSRFAANISALQPNCLVSSWGKLWCMPCASSWVGVIRRGRVRNRRED